MNTASQPIGVFDSGIGGLTVAHALAKRLPNEQLIYFGDTAHLPYGDKSADAIRYFCLKIGKFLLEQNCKCIVIACNSAAATAGQVMREFFGNSVPIIDVIEPLVQHVAAQARYRKVGVIATKATIGSGVYERRLRELRPQSLDIAALATPLLVPMIEEGFFKNNISRTIIDAYLANETLQGIDALLLACTHYPLIHKEIAAFYDNKIDVLDSNTVAAEAVAAALTRLGLLSTERAAPHRFLVSDYTDSFDYTARLFYPNEKFHLELHNIWEERLS